MTLSVIAALDAFYLMHRPAYDEMLDGAIRAAGIDSNDWPVDVGVDERFLVDPAYHFLHRAERYITREDPAEAERNFILAMSTLAGEDCDPNDVTSVVRAAIRADTIAKHHRTKAIRVVAQLHDADWLASAHELLEKPELAGRGQSAPAIPAIPATPAKRRPGQVGRATPRWPTAKDHDDDLDRDPLSHR
jgi:hypothetical protein